MRNIKQTFKAIYQAKH
uniref:Uncharacterized protein n=1 Tax=Anguilla anguilla TaxID=7936 RepID=A0A0E9UPY6_ANGAN